MHMCAQIHTCLFIDDMFMYACVVHMYMQVCIRTGVYVHVGACAHVVQVCVHRIVYVYAYAGGCMYICRCGYLYIYSQVCICMCAGLCICVL